MPTNQHSLDEVGQAAQAKSRADLPPALHAAALFDAFPDWLALARVETQPDGRAYLVVEVPPSRSGDLMQGLLIHTDDGEITVGFDCYHAHFDQWGETAGGAGPTCAIAFLSQLVDERIVVVSYWHGDVWKGSATRDADHQPRPPDWLRPGTFDRIRIRSWRGTHDRDLRV